MGTTRTRQLAAPKRTARSELPVRVVLFLRAAGAHPGIRGALGEGGFTKADHEEGALLLVNACAWDDGGLDASEDRPAREARERIGAFVQDHFPRLRAAIARKCPEHAGLFAFKGAATSDPVVALGIWLSRVSELEGRADGRAVLATLEQRGVDALERARLARDIAVATAAKDVTAAPARDRDADFAALHGWYLDWSATARAVIRRRDWLVTLGVGGRRKGGEPGDAASVAH